MFGNVETKESGKEDGCLTKKQSLLFYGHLKVFEKAVDKPCHLFVGKKPGLPVFSREQNHQGTDLPKIESLSEYVGIYKSDDRLGLKRKNPRKEKTLRKLS